VKVVARDLGYEDPYHFSRVFKRIMGVSPEQYRRGLDDENGGRGNSGRKLPQGYSIREMPNIS
jgi:AraC-like DNA-binding protein